MSGFKAFYTEVARFFGYFRSVALLMARLVVAYGFYEPAMMKFADISATAEWFGSIGIPFPTLNAYMAATTELTGVVLLTLGLMTRWIAIPMMVIMTIAILTVHIGNGFSCGNNGFEIPFYYFIFLFIFVTHGAGRFSIDYLIFKEEQ